LNGPDTQRTAEVSITEGLRLASIEAEIVEEMPPGASTRRFFRLKATSGATLVAMYAPRGVGGPVQAKQALGHEPFLRARALLASWGLPVPAVHAFVEERDLLIVEDLGPETLALHLERYPEHAPRLYTHAVELLARAQDRFATASERCIVHERAFDYELLRFEVDHFLDYGLLASGVQVSAAGRSVFEAAAHFLASSIAELERGFSHRDYQSKNLMVRDVAGSLQLTWIDFQDAMLGPRAYDLVALLMDSYQSFDDAFVEARLRDYCQARGGIDLAELRAEFDLITVQRKLKDAGRFVYMLRKRENPSFLCYVDASIARARAALDRVRDATPALERLADFLSEVVPQRTALSAQST